MALPQKREIRGTTTVDDVLGLLSTSRHGHRSTMTDLAKPAQPKSRREMAKVDYDDSFERMLSAQELEELIQLKQATGGEAERLKALAKAAAAAAEVDEELQEQERLHRTMERLARSVSFKQNKAVGSGPPSMADASADGAGPSGSAGGYGAGDERGSGGSGGGQAQQGQLRPSAVKFSADTADPSADRGTPTSKSRPGPRRAVSWGKTTAALVAEHVMAELEEGFDQDAPSPRATPIAGRRARPSQSGEASGGGGTGGGAASAPGSGPPSGGGTVEAFLMQAAHANLPGVARFGRRSMTGSARASFEGEPSPLNRSTSSLAAAVAGSGPPQASLSQPQSRLSGNVQSLSRSGSGLTAAHLEQLNFNHTYDAISKNWLGDSSGTGHLQHNSGSNALKPGTPTMSRLGQDALAGRGQGEEGGQPGAGIVRSMSRRISQAGQGDEEGGDGGVPCWLGSSGAAAGAGARRPPGRTLSTRSLGNGLCASAAAGANSALPSPTPPEGCAPLPTLQRMGSRVVRRSESNVGLRASCTGEGSVRGSMTGEASGLPSVPGAMKPSSKVSMDYQDVMAAQAAARSTFLRLTSMQRNNS